MSYTKKTNRKKLPLLSDGTILHEYLPDVQDSIAEQGGLFYQLDTRRDEPMILA